MQKLCCIIFLAFTFLVTPVFSEVLQAGVSVNEVPKEFFGQWQVRAKLDKTNSAKTFKPQSVDFWSLSRYGEIISLLNPTNGANSDISVNTVEGNLIIFTRKSSYDSNKYLTDKVSIRLNGNKFTGINELTLETRSLIDNHLLKTETATYLINGEKLAN